MSTAQRKTRIAQLREEGTAAYYAGKPRGSNPHRFEDTKHWHAGWDEAEEQATQQHAAVDAGVMDSDADLAIAIGEHAHAAGWDACLDWVRGHVALVDAGMDAEAKQNAWSAYAPPEELCGRSFARLTTVTPS